MLEHRGDESYKYWRTCISLHAPSLLLKQVGNVSSDHKGAFYYWVLVARAEQLQTSMHLGDDILVTSSTEFVAAMLNQVKMGATNHKGFGV